MSTIKLKVCDRTGKRPAPRRRRSIENHSFDYVRTSNRKSAIDVYNVRIITPEFRLESAMTKRIPWLVVCMLLVYGLAGGAPQQRTGGGRWAFIDEILGKYKADDPQAHAELMKLRTTDPDAYRGKVGKLVRAAAEKDPELKKKLDRARARPGPTPIFKPPDSVKVVRDIVYATYGDRKVMLDLYLPASPPAGKMPCIMVVHGGGWRSGDKNKFARFASAFAEKGFAAACIAYRLRPEVEIRQCVEDAKASVRWVRANAGKYAIDVERIGAFGGSAGAHLVAMLGTSFKAAKLEGNGGNEGVSSRVHAVVALATPADLTAFGRFMGKTEAAKLISPVTYVDSHSAKFLLMHCKGDRLVPYKQSLILQEKLKKANVPVRLITIVRGGHAFWNGKTAKATKARADAVSFFQETFKTPKTKPDTTTGEKSD